MTRLEEWVKRNEEIAGCPDAAEGMAVGFRHAIEVLEEAGIKIKSLIAFDLGKLEGVTRCLKILTDYIEQEI